MDKGVKIPREKDSLKEPRMCVWCVEFETGYTVPVTVRLNCFFFPLNLAPTLKKFEKLWKEIQFVERIGNVRAGVPSLWLDTSGN